MAGNSGHIRSGASSGNMACMKAETIPVPSPSSGNQWNDAAPSDYNPAMSQASSNGQPIGASSGGSSQGQPQNHQHAVDKRRLANLISEVDPFQQVDEDAESCLLDIADDFIDTVLTAACQVAKHRKSSVLEVKDVQYVLETQYNLWMPGFGGISDTKQAYKRPAPTESHKQRMAIIRKLFKTH